MNHLVGERTVGPRISSDGTSDGGERFRVGEVVCQGVELCEPCGHLESLTEEGAVSALLHRGGLCAEIVESGTVRMGDEVEPL